MEDANAATSPSAAAVADGASAAANTKTVGTSANAKPSTYVKLLIKASNQQFDDQVIESDLSWTVKRLKSHLSIAYPSKPPEAEQKLIYSGQLLNDNLQLKEVIRSYKDVYTQNHIIHLVYTPKNLTPIASSNSKLKKNATPLESDSGLDNITSEVGVRFRHTLINSAQTASNNMQRPVQHLITGQVPYTQYLPQPNIQNGLGPLSPLTQNQIPGYGQFNIQALVMQHNAMYSWMQQVYSQYMEQCLRVSNLNETAGQTPTNYSRIPQCPYFTQYPQSVIPAVTQTTIVDNATSAPGNQTAQPEQEAQAQQDAPRFPNLPQEDQENRDWLDNIFSITRFALFLTILYFNSSPLRCLAVVIIAGGIYLYHIGVFRFRHERNNNNLNRNNNAAQNAAVDQIRQGVDQQQPQPEAEAEIDGQENQDVDDHNVANRPPTAHVGAGSEQHQVAAVLDAENSLNNETNNINGSSISILRTFVVTFFTSLLPETPPV